MEKIVCYSCCTGGYDDILQYDVINPDWKYVFFTDDENLIQQKKVGQWEIRPLVYNSSTNVKNARWHKINAHLLFPEYSFSLWLDAEIKIHSKNVISKIDQLISDNTLIAVPLHPERICAYQEAEKIIELGIDYPEIVQKEIDFLQQEGYPINNGLNETCILFRQHNKIKEAMDLWWKMVETYSKRDQLSFNYAMWKNNITITPLYSSGRDHHLNGDFVFIFGKNHNQDKVSSNLLKNIYFFDENGEYPLTSLSQLPQNLIIEGNPNNNNIVKIHKKLKCRHISLRFFPNCSNAYCELDSSDNCAGLDIDVVFQDGEGSILTIGHNTEMNGTKIWLGMGSQCYIGSDCLFSYDVIIRTTDGHVLYDKNTQEILNLQKNPCIIGDHCWIGSGTIINKNAQLADNVVVRSGSVLTEPIWESFVCIEGNPAQIIKKDVAFSASSLYMATHPIEKEKPEVTAQNPVEVIKSLGVKVGKNFRPIIWPHSWSYPNFGSEPWFIEIGDDVCISFGCTFLTHDAGIHVCEKLQPDKDLVLLKYGKIKIGNNCFIGCNSTILPNVTIGDNCIVGAGSIVTKNIPSGEVWAGNPAHFITTIEKFTEKSLALFHTKEQQELREFVFKKRNLSSSLYVPSHPIEEKSRVYEFYKEKFSKAGWSLEKKENKYFLSNDKLSVCGDADNTLWTAWGVFCKDEYGFFDNEPYVMIDIGLNLAFTSLRLATEDHIVKVYGFEPFTPTYKLAVDNLKKNPKYAHKIEIFNYGLSDKDGSLDIHYNPNLPGSMSTIKDRFTESEAVETVQLKKSSTVLKEILSKHTEKVFVKIDCEGAEKEIIPDLAKSGVLKKINLINMEWHFENPKNLIEILKQEGFVLICHHDEIDEIGTLIAFKK